MGAGSISISSWWEQHKRTIALIGAGHLSYGVFNWFYDQILYIFIIYRLGLLWGGGLMTLGSLLQCAALLLMYQRLKIDWVGVGALYSLAKKPSPSFIEKILICSMKKGWLPIFLTLCVVQDPFVTTAYFKKGRFEALSTKDWGVFSASILVSNGYWIARSGLIAEVIYQAWSRFERST